jgi:hypothetical protein
MADHVPATSSAKALGKVVFLLASITVVAFLAAWFGAGAICFFSLRFHSDLADLTCGHNVVYPAILLFLLLWPALLFTLARLFRRQ